MIKNVRFRQYRLTSLKFRQKKTIVFTFSDYSLQKFSSESFFDETSEKKSRNYSVFLSTLLLPFLVLLEGCYLPFLSEKVFHQLGTFVSQYASSDGAARMEGLGGKALEAALFVRCTIDESPQLAPTDGTGTHDAGFDRDVERTAVEILAAQLLGCRRNGLHFGMCRHVVKGFCQVVSATDNASVGNHNGTDRYFVALQGLLGFGKCFSHPAFIFVEHKDKC